MAAPVEPVMRSLALSMRADEQRDTSWSYEYLHSTLSRSGFADTSNSAQWKAMNQAAISDSDAEKHREGIEDANVQMRMLEMSRVRAQGALQIAEKNKNKSSSILQQMATGDLAESRRAQIVNIQNIRRAEWVHLNATHKFDRPEHRAGLFDLPTINGTAQEGFLQVCIVSRAM